jgi:hypothetical protein
LSPEYLASQDKPAERKGFKTAEIGNWILKHNQDYIDHYRGRDSHVNNSIKLGGVLKKIKRFLDNLEQWGLIKQSGLVDADTNNGLKTPLYRFTYVGYLIAWVLEYCYKPDKRKIARRSIFDLIQLIMIVNHSYVTDFLARVYAKYMEKDLWASPFIPKNARKIFDRIIIVLIHLLSSGKFQAPKAIEYLSKAHDIVIKDKENREILQRLYFDALGELQEDIRKKFIAHEKAAIENDFVISQPSKDWEDTYFENLTNYDTLVLYAICQNKQCEKRYPTIINYYDYKKKLQSSPVNSNYLIENCKYCSTKNSLHVFDSFEAAR